MTASEINAVIAEACGYVPCAGWIPFNSQSMIKECSHPKCYPDGMPPNYHGDLNAIHEAEKILRVDQLELYLHWLVPNEQQWIKYPMNAYWLICHATSPTSRRSFLEDDWQMV